MRVLGPQRSMAAERQMRRALGAEMTDLALESSVGYPVPLPVARTGLYVVDGIVVPRIAGGAGFTSLSDIVAEATGGAGGGIKQQTVMFAAIGTLTIVGTAESWWSLQGQPGVGKVPPALPAGEAPTRATQGAMGQADPGGTDTLHVVHATIAQSAAQTALVVIYDRLWHGTMVMASTASQSVTGVPTRYTGTASKGNVMWAEIRTVLAATAHNLTFTYVDQDGNAAEAAPAVGGVTSGAASRMDHQGWMVPLNGGDTGVREIDAVQASASIATGAIDIVVARPLVMVPMNSVAGGHVDLINSAFNLTQVLPGACLNGLTMRAGTIAAHYFGQLVLVSG